MGKTLDWIQEDPKSGRLIYRRVYPEDVRPFLSKPGQRELKVPLGASRVMTAASFRAYEDAKRRFERDVTHARSAMRIEPKRAAQAELEPLNAADIDYIASLLVHNHREAIEPLLKGGLGPLFTDAWNILLPGLRKLRAKGDTEHLVEGLGPALKDLLAAENIRLDPTDAQGFKDLVWACSRALVQAGPDVIRHFEGDAPALPPKPERPSNPKGGKRTVEALVNAYIADKWEGWSTSSRKATAPVSRVLKETLGNREASSIDRDTAREVFEIVKSLPLSWGKRADLKGLTVREIVAEGARQGLPTLSPKTVNEGYMVHVSGIFNWAEREEWVVKNPFMGLSAADKVDDADRRDSFKADQLQTLFTSSPWDRPYPFDAQTPGKFWVPLIALYSGMRLAEIAGLRLMDVEALEDIPAFLIRPHERRGIKNAESRRNIPIHPTLLALGLQAFAAHRHTVAKPEELLFPDAKANVHRQAGAKLGEWFSRLVNKQHGFKGTKLGMHSFRHNFEDRLRAAGLSGRAEGQALSGRKILGSEGSYGSAFAIGDLLVGLKNVSYPGLDLSHLLPEKKA